MKRRLDSRKEEEKERSQLKCDDEENEENEATVDSSERKIRDSSY